MLKQAPSFPAFRLNLAWDYRDLGQLLILERRYDEAADAKVQAAPSQTRVKRPRASSLRRPPSRIIILSIPLIVISLT